MKQAQMTADEVARELSEVARAETPVSEAGKMKALEMLAKVHKMLTDRVESDITQRPASLDDARRLYLDALRRSDPSLSESDAEARADAAFATLPVVDIDASDHNVS